MRPLRSDTWYQEPHTYQCDDANQRDQRKRRVPSETLTDESTKRHTHHHGHGQTKEHGRNRRCAALLGYERFGNDRPDAEERSVVERGDDAGEQQDPISIRDRGKAVARNKKHEHQHQDRFAVHAAQRKGEDGAADRYAERVSRDQEAGRRNRDVQIRRDFR